MAMPAGTEGVEVESFEHPARAYAVDFPVPDDRLFGGQSFEDVMVTPEQFEVNAGESGKPLTSLL